MAGETTPTHETPSRVPPQGGSGTAPPAAGATALEYHLRAALVEATLLKNEAVRRKLTSARDYRDAADLVRKAVALAITLVTIDRED